MSKIVAIDGPAGAGKSTVAKLVSQRLGLPVLDTGSLYRAVGWAVLQNGGDPTDEEMCEEILKDLKIEILGPGQVAVNGRDISGEIRTPAVSSAASKVAVHQKVHDALEVLFRQYGSDQGCVAEGRDIGTTVFPNATLKVFLTATEPVRYRRTALERGEEAASQIKERDHREANRLVSPMVQAEDAVLVDSSEMCIEEVVDLIIDLFQQKVETR